jgi:hypothetical protein
MMEEEGKKRNKREIKGLVSTAWLIGEERKEIKEGKTNIAGSTFCYPPI